MLGLFDLYLLVAFIFVACATGRLARFNVDAEKNLLQNSVSQNENSTELSGIPTPVGAMLLCSVVMAHHETGLLFLKSVEFMGPYVFLIALPMDEIKPLKA